MDDVSLYLIHPAMKPWLDEFLLAKGFEVRRTPFLDSEEDDALPTYLVTPTEERMRGVIP